MQKNPQRWLKRETCAGPSTGKAGSVWLFAGYDRDSVRNIHSNAVYLCSVVEKRYNVIVCLSSVGEGGVGWANFTN